MRLKRQRPPAQNIPLDLRPKTLHKDTPPPTADSLTKRALHLHDTILSPDFSSDGAIEEYQSIWLESLRPDVGSTRLTRYLLDIKLALDQQIRQAFTVYETSEGSYKETGREVLPEPHVRQSKPELPTFTYTPPPRISTFPSGISDSSGTITVTMINKPSICIRNSRSVSILRNLISDDNDDERRRLSFGTIDLRADMIIHSSPDNTHESIITFTGGQVDRKKDIDFPDNDPTKDQDISSIEAIMTQINRSPPSPRSPSPPYSPCMILPVTPTIKGQSKLKVVIPSRKKTGGGMPSASKLLSPENRSAAAMMNFSTLGGQMKRIECCQTA